ncbi:Hypothetical Protein FCC1311_027032 [Hondaea fermentalgiana]|uniref:Uncharacterized protein n=1 Tax=Hondaea fermentalgiana TaxID=2315210 RepID=A0A2R5G5Z8_9STRA|nr:Hypothetical Protein FCC1311_027032 [Hondaea fermentalgiana]|eukprot:GBG26482.1 Hypothetical Protein FCC1311_027032 [Hondaea fermentalgiana]
MDSALLDKALGLVWGWLEDAEGLGERLVGLDAGASHLVSGFAASVALLVVWILLSMCTPLSWQVLGTARLCRVTCVVAIGLKTIEVYLSTHLDAPTMRAAAQIVPGLTYTSMTAILLGQTGILFLGQFVSAGGLARFVFMICTAASATLDAFILSELEILLICAEEEICGSRRFDVEAMQWRVILLLSCFAVQVLAINFCAYLSLQVGPFGVAKMYYSSELVSAAELKHRNIARRKVLRVQRMAIREERAQQGLLQEQQLEK